MSWLWSSYRDYVTLIAPITNPPESYWRDYKGYSTFQYLSHLLYQIDEFGTALDELIDLRHDIEETGYPAKPEDFIEMHQLVENLVSSGELIFLLDKRLANSQRVRNFLEARTLATKWDTYDFRNLVLVVVPSFIASCTELLELHDAIAHEGQVFIGELNLPPSAETDFEISRNLFSVGFDEVGLLIAGRGLEGVLRALAKRKRIKIVQKGKESPAHEATFRDLIEIMYRVRWQKDKSPLIDSETRNLLHFLRETRNSGAHPTTDVNRKLRNSREMALIVGQNATNLWNDERVKRAHVQKTSIEKDW